MTYSIEEMLQFQLYTIDEKGNPIPIIHVDNKEPYYVYELLKNVNINNINKNKRCAFTQNELNDLHKDRATGLSIRKLALKYNKSDKTIQKYLKITKI